MQFNFRLFSRLVHYAMQETTSVYSESEVLYVFRCYFECFEEYTGHVHPNIRKEQIKRIIEKMPYLDSSGPAGQRDIDPEDYEALIEQHFNTPYQNCDFNINHFFSGMIRELRYYEILY